MTDDSIQLARIEQLLEENLEATEETNAMIRDMRRLGRMWFWLRILIWASVIILPFLLLKPILETLIPATATGSGFFGFPSQDGIQKAIDSYQIQ